MSTDSMGDAFALRRARTYADLIRESRFVLVESGDCPPGVVRAEILPDDCLVLRVHSSLHERVTASVGRLRGKGGGYGDQNP